jgi:hypothetical protein
MLRIKTFKQVCVLFIFLFGAMIANAQASYDGLLRDIPEPPEARAELPSPIPMVYEFMGGMMDGKYDVCLANFEVETFLKLMYGRLLTRMDPSDYKELFSYQIQTHRNEFKFLSKIMNRVAEGASIDYSNPRYHGKVQSKVVVRLDTNRGRFDFVVYCCYTNGRWYIYDYVLNNQRLTQTFKASLQGITPERYMYTLRPFYNQRIRMRPFKNQDFDFGIHIPAEYNFKENVSDALLGTLSGFNGTFLLHIQATTYDAPQNLAQVGVGIKNSLMPFDPRLYDQWKGDLAGVEVGNILFNFQMGNRRLYTHMVLIPLGRKLVALNFYHSSLQMLKHMTNIREQMLSTMSLPRIEAYGGVMPGEIPDELTLSDDFSDDDFGDSLESNPMSYSGNTPSYGQSYQDVQEPSYSTPSADFSNNYDDDDESYGYEEYSDYDDYDDEPEMLTPNTYTNDYSDSSNQYGYDDDDDDYIPPPPTGSYGDGNFGNSGSSNYDYYDDYYPGDEGTEVTF